MDEALTSETQSTTAPPAEQPERVDDGEPEVGGTLQGRFWVNSLIGGSVGFLLGAILASVFFPIYFLGIVGGGFVGGLLQNTGSGGGVSVGATSGFLATIPLFLVMVAFVTLGAGWLTAAGVPTEVTDEYLGALGFIAVFVSLVALILNILCGIFGGLVGGAVAD